MPDSHAESAAPKVALDTGIIPLGERALQGVLDYVSAVGDEAETTYLEVKSDVDLGSKAGVAKVAKFLLGAANRRPREASRHFHGYAVMVIGAQKGGALGVRRGVEPHELEDRLRPYLGPQFPAFEFARIAVGADREVLFIVAPPPADGQAIFPCHKDFHGDDRRDNLDDGAIYVRGSSNTRHARSGEVLALVERARGGSRSHIELEVEVLGSVGRVGCIDEAMMALYEGEDELFRKKSEPVTGVFAAASFTLSQSIFGGAGPRTAEKRQEALEQWRSRRHEFIARGREHLLGVALPGVGVRVVSRNRFVAKPHLTLTFHDCEVIDHVPVDDAEFEKLVEPVVREQKPWTAAAFAPSRLDVTPRGYPVAWANRGDDAAVVLTPESFRPNAPWVSEHDDYVLVARDDQASFAVVTWELLTEDGSDVVTCGEFNAPTSKYLDAADLIQKVFFDED